MSIRVLLAVAVLSLVPAVAVAQPPDDSDRPAADLYKTTCQPCHMADGNAALEPMNFVDGKWRHGSSVHDIAETIEHGVQGTAMVPFKGRFSEKEILALARYVRAFDKSLKPDTGKTARKKSKG